MAINNQFDLATTPNPPRAAEIFAESSEPHFACS
jgi:hypothetical protein